MINKTVVRFSSILLGRSSTIFILALEIQFEIERYLEDLYNLRRIFFQHQNSSWGYPTSVLYMIGVLEIEVYRNRKT